jgi:hypothetical protein
LPKDFVNLCHLPLTASFSLTDFRARLAQSKDRIDVRKGLVTTFLTGCFLFRCLAVLCLLL